MGKHGVPLTLGNQWIWLKRGTPDFICLTLWQGFDCIAIAITITSAITIAITIAFTIAVTIAAAIALTTTIIIASIVIPIAIY